MPVEIESNKSPEEIIDTIELAVNGGVTAVYWLEGYNDCLDGHPIGKTAIEIVFDGLKPNGVEVIKRALGVGLFETDTSESFRRSRESRQVAPTKYPHVYFYETDWTTEEVGVKSSFIITNIINPYYWRSKSNSSC